MKRFLNQILSALIILFLHQALSGQECICDFSNLPDPDNTTGIPMNSENGWYITTQGTVRALVVFFEIEYDINTDPDLSIDEWVPNSLPDWADDVFDPYSPVGTAQGIMTQYFQEASLNNLTIIGDYLLPQSNGGVFKVLESDILDPQQYPYTVICNAINSAMNGNFETKNGLNSVTFFDNWTNVINYEPYLPKETPSQDSPNGIDHLVILWRNHPSYNGRGESWPGFPPTILGNSVDTWSMTGSRSKIPTALMRHEISHLLFGGLDFHCGGGGTEENYWIPFIGGWSCLGLATSSVQTCNAWDRHRAGWTPTNNLYEISARDQNNSSEVNGDLDATDFSQEGIYYLRDFIADGDAIRIKLPFINSNDEFPQYIWIENHKGNQLNNSPFDAWQYQENSCIEPLEPGLLVQLQIDRDVRSGNTSSDMSDGYAGYLRPLPANGFYDREFENNTVYNDCIQNNTTYAFEKILPNPLTGGGDQECYSLDTDNDDQLKHYDERYNFVQKINGTYYRHLYEMGHTSHSFTLPGNNKINISTNPSSASRMNLVGRSIPIYEEKNLRKVYLNGISIEILEQYTNGDIKLDIQFDHIDIENDVRWCADEIVLNHIANPSGYSLNLKNGKTLLLDQSCTATRMTNPTILNGNAVFTSPTLFRCKPNTIVNMEPNSHLHLINGSTILLESISELHAWSGATIELENFSKIIIEDGSRLVLKNGSSLKLNDNSEIIVEFGGELVIQDNVNIYGNANDQIIVEGNIQVGSNVVFQDLDDSGVFKGLFLNNLALQTNLNNVTFYKAGLDNSGIELNITNSTFDNCYIIYSHIGNVNVSFSNFIRTWLYLENEGEGFNFTATVDNCSFFTDATMAGIDIWNYDNFFITDNSIDGYYNGIQLMVSGEGSSGNQHITNNQIINSTNAGIIAYNSTASIANNYLCYNKYGVWFGDHSNIALYGHVAATTYAEAQQILNNDSYEVYASQYSFPWYFRHNVIIDEDNLGNPDDPLVYYDNPFPGPIEAKYNCWGNPVYFNPIEDLKPYSAYTYLPEWCPGGGLTQKSDVEQLYLDADSLFASKQYDLAQDSFGLVVSQFPSTIYAQSALKKIFSLENFLTKDYLSLQTYLSSDSIIQSDSILTTIATFLSNKCEVKLENWQKAIDHYEGIILNPPSYNDSIFAIVDLGHTYFLMENSGLKSAYHGRLEEYIPKSRKQYYDDRNFLLSLIPCVKNDITDEELSQSSIRGELIQNKPNPFSATTTIHYIIHDYGMVKVDIYNSSGVNMRSYNLYNQDPGIYEIYVDLEDIASGLYFYTLSIDGHVIDTKKMLYIK